LNFQIGAERGQTLAISGVDARASELSGKQLAVTGTQGTDVNFGTLTDITINGGAAIDLQSVTNRQGVIDAINNAYPDGTVQAKGLETKVTLGAFAATNGEKVTIGSTEFAISTTSGSEANDTAAKLVASINASTELGDITASLDSSNNLVLTSASGADIKVEESVDGLLDGTTTDYTTAKTFTGGIEISSSLKTLTIGGTDKTTLGLTAAAADQTLSIDSVSVTSRFNANNALVALDGAIDMVTSMRADLGAIQNRFENVIEVAAVQNENLSAARSRIQDADFAAETANLTRAQILQQAGLASLAQANASPQAVLSLLG
jgi:flagellin